MICSLNRVNTRGSGMNTPRTSSITWMFVCFRMGMPLPNSTSMTRWRQWPSSSPTLPPTMITITPVAQIMWIWPFPLANSQDGFQPFKSISWESILIRIHSKPPMITPTMPYSNSISTQIQEEVSPPVPRINGYLILRIAPTLMKSLMLQRLMKPMGWV